jgi:hypothetical protein
MCKASVLFRCILLRKYLHAKITWFMHDILPAPSCPRLPSWESFYRYAILAPIACIAQQWPCWYSSAEMQNEYTASLSTYLHCAKPRGYFPLPCEYNARCIIFTALQWTLCSLCVNPVYSIQYTYATLRHTPLLFADRNKIRSNCKHQSTALSQSVMPVS